MRQESVRESGHGTPYGVGGACLIMGAAIGALTMYFCDPNRGRLRRAMVQQRATKIVRQGGEGLTGRADDVLNRVHRLVAKATEWLEHDEQISDDVLAARVRSRLGHLTAEAHSIESSVKGGIVNVKGPLGVEKRRILAGIWSIPGVQEVHVVPGHSAV